MKDSFIFYRSYYEALSGLKDKDKLQLFNAICEMSLNENEIKLTGICKNIFAAIKPQIIANSERYKNGKKGGRPKKETIGFQKEKTIGYEIKKPNENENVNENVNENITTAVVNNANDSCVDGLQKIIDFYNNNIGLLTPYGLELFQDYLKEIDYEVILFAMQKAVEANKRQINYIKGTLNNWINKGIKTLIQAQEENENYKNKTVMEENKIETLEEKNARKVKELEEAIKNDTW